MPPQPASLFDFDFYEPLPIQVEVSDAPLTSDAGLLPLRQFDHRIGLTAQFAAALHDPRNPDRIEHSFRDMVRMRVFGILAGSEDQNDHDTLRTDPVFKLLAGRSPTDADPRGLAERPNSGAWRRRVRRVVSRDSVGLLGRTWWSGFRKPESFLAAQPAAGHNGVPGVHIATVFRRG